MDKKTIFERLEYQNKIWKIGLYDYLYNSVYSMRFAIANYYVQQFFKQAKILDVGAGSGTLLGYLNNVTTEYYYNDISEYALNIFKNSKIYANNKSKIKIIFGNINDIDLDIEVDVIISLGVVKYLYDKNTFLLLFEKKLKKNGIMLLETTEACDGFSYYCKDLPNPIHSVKYELLNNSEFDSSKTRIINVYRKESDN